MLFFLNSCNKKIKSKPLQAVVGEFLANSEGIAGYGFIDLDKLSQKADFNSIPLFGKSAANILKNIQKSVKLSDKVYYAFSSIDTNQLLPKYSYIFLALKDVDRFRKLMESMGYTFNKKNNMMYAEDNTTAIGTKEDKAIILIGDNLSNGNCYNKIALAFAQMKKSSSEKVIKNILQYQSDVLLAVNCKDAITALIAKKSLPSAFIINRIYQLNKSGQLVITLNFEKGKIVSKIDLRYLSLPLKKFLFFKRNGNPDILNFLGNGLPQSVLTLSLDMEKLNQFAKYFSKDKSLSFLRIWGTTGVILEGLAKGNLANLINGEIGIKTFNNPKTSKNLYFHLGKER